MINKCLKIIFCLLLCTVCLLGTGIYSVADTIEVEEVSASDNKVNNVFEAKLLKNCGFYKNADEKAPKLGKIAKGTKVTVLSVESQFTKISYLNKTGYVKTKYINVYSTGKTTIELNLFDSTGDKRKPLCTVPAGKTVRILSEYDSVWSEVIYGKYRGYLMSCFIERTKPKQYKWETDKSTGLRFAYDLYGNRVSDTSSLTSGPYRIVVYKDYNTAILYSQDKNGAFTIPTRTMICSCGNYTPYGTYYVPAKFRWLQMVDDSFGQFVTSICGNILFHTVPCYSMNNFDIEVEEFNGLGETRSLGCVRLLSSDAEFIFNYVDYSTEVVITDEACPLEQPAHPIVDEGHTWDPTDSTAHYMCTELGCH